MLEQITCPTLVLHSRADGNVPFTHAQFVARTVPKVQLLAIEDCGHLIWVGPRASQAREQVLAFLGHHAPPPPTPTDPTTPNTSFASSPRAGATALSLLNRIDFAEVAAVYYLIEVPFLLSVLRAYRRGWTVASMKDDWKTIFTPEHK
jgi:hypothetical protein